MAERGGCATAFLWLLGLVVLFPGLCILFFADQELSRKLADYGPLILWGAIGIVVCAVIYLIYDFSRDRGDSGN